MIWQRYVLREILKTFFLFLGCFYFLYAVIDYSSHMQDFFSDRKIEVPHLCMYYLFHFVKRADLLIPLGLLLATLRTLLSLNARGELIALRASGISLRKILHPFLWTALGCSLFCWANFEFFIPSSLQFLDRFKEENFKTHHNLEKMPLHTIFLKDGSKIIYQSYLKERGAYFDVFWIRSSHDIWRMKYLSQDLRHPKGEWVDHILCNAEGTLEKTESFSSCSFTPFQPVPNQTRKGTAPPENRKISTLLRSTFSGKQMIGYDSAPVLTQLLFKIMIPLLSFLAVLAPAPFCVRHSRNSSPFLLYALALFGFLFFFTFLDSCIILGENRTVYPSIAILLPFFLVFALSGWSYRKSL